jgi:hypothetical protein
MKPKDQAKPFPEPQTARAGGLEIRTHADGSLDEVAALGVSVRLEQITRQHWHLHLADAHGRTLSVTLRAARDTVRGEAGLEGIPGDLPRQFATKATHPNKPFPRSIKSP